MLTIILLALACAAILGFVVYTVFLDDKKELFSRNFFRKAEKKADHRHVDTTLFQEGLQHIVFHHPDLQAIHTQLRKKIIGMDGFLNAIILNVLCGGHLLIEGVPGLAKTKTIHTFSEIMGMQFKRIQFTPDMLPADIIGIEMYDSVNKCFEAKLGPIMANIILADEINRATPKVQSALLESMQEHQVTIGGNSFALPDPFFVLATQNPIEQEGTYPLPEAQIDRFLFKILVDYPSLHDEKKILDEMELDSSIQVQQVFSLQHFFELKAQVDTVTLQDPIKHYITKLIHATRTCPLLVYGSSPRGSIGIMVASKALAFCQGRNYVTHDDVQKVALAVLRHRVIVSYEAKMEGRSADDILVEVFAEVKLA